MGRLSSDGSLARRAFDFAQATPSDSRGVKPRAPARRAARIPSMIKNRKTADHYTWGDGCDGWRLLDCADLTVTEERMPPGESEINHSHGRSRQLFFV